MTTKQLYSLLRKHKLWLKGYKCGKCLDLSNMDLSYMDLSYTDLSKANLCKVKLTNSNLRWANLSNANLQFANLNHVDLYSATLQGADLEGATLQGADLRDTNLKSAGLKRTNFKNSILSFADLQGANLYRAILKDSILEDVNLRDSNLSGAKNLLSAIDYLEKNFEKTKDGYIVYKEFNANYGSPKYWRIEDNSIIKENVDTNRSTLFSYGITVGTLNYVKKRRYFTETPIYKLLIKYEWLAGVVVPYETIGSIRCERAMILKKIDEN